MKMGPDRVGGRKEHVDGKPRAMVDPGCRRNEVLLADAYWPMMDRLIPVRTTAAIRPKAIAQKASGTR